MTPPPPYTASASTHLPAEAYLEDENISYRDAIRAFRKKLIEDRLQRHGGSVSAAARSLGISERTFYRKWSEAKRPL